MSPFNELVTELKTLDTIRQFHGNLDRWRDNLQTLADAKAQALRMGKSISVRYDRPAFRSAASGSRIDPVEALLRDYGKVRADADTVGAFVNGVRRQVVAKALQKADSVVPAETKPTKRKTMKPASVTGSYAPAPYHKPKAMPKPKATAAEVIAKATKARADLVAQITLGRMSASEINAKDLKLRNIIARANRAQSASA